MHEYYLIQAVTLMKWGNYKSQDAEKNSSLNLGIQEDELITKEKQGDCLYSLKEKADKTQLSDKLECTK